MKDWKDKLSRFARIADSLDDRIYFAVLAIGVVAVAAAFIMGLFQGLSFFSELSTFICAVWLVILGIISVRRPSARRVCRVILVCGLNFALLPLAYYSSGALTSGMPLFYLLGLFLVAALLRGRTRTIVFFASLFALLFSIYFGRIHPELITPLTPLQQYQDVKITFFLTGMTLGSMTIGILNAYDLERRRNQELMEQLTSLSIRDPLSGLYNRRELFRRLDLMYLGDETLRREQGCIAMFDVDNFKRLNDTYGHQFGDTVLSTVAAQLQGEANAEAGELAARYGGEEFVLVLRADSLGDAFTRVDSMRARIAAIQWEDVPALRVTISGGLVSCAGYSDLKNAMHDVDQLLYQAKGMGKNRIADRFIDHPAAS